MKRYTTRMTDRDRSLAIITVNYNAGDLLIRCIHSCLGCPQPEAIIVADNGSKDASLEKLIQSVSNPRLKIIRNGKNLGFAAGNNRGLAETSADYLLLLNPDCVIQEVPLNTLLEQLDRHPRLGMAGPLILNEDGSEQRGCRRDEPTPIKTLKTLFSGRKGGVNQVNQPLPQKSVEVEAISGACMLVRREALEDVGLMDEGYFLHFEDLDWCKRFWLKGWKVMFVPDAVITHYKGGSSRSRPVRVEWHKHKGMVRYYRKFYSGKYPRPLLWSVYAAVWARFFAMVPVWLIRGAKP